MANARSRRRSIAWLRRESDKRRPAGRGRVFRRRRLPIRFPNSRCPSLSFVSVIHRAKSEM